MDIDKVFNGVEPQRVFKKFWEVSQVYPRKSGSMQNISDYMVGYGQALGLEVIQDDALNVIIKKPATKGYENAPTVMLASHMDMICETRPGVKHDFFSEPLYLKIDDKNEIIYAEGTTLGADNAIGMAFTMAVLESDDIPHPAIEAVFTTEEETDMKGAWNLAYDKLESNLILSLDATRLSMGGSGELEVEMRVPRTCIKADNNSIQYTLTVGNLIGGHSGKNAFIERGNAITILNRMLSDLRKRFGIKIAYIKGGEGMSTAIARDSECTISFNKNLLNEIEAAINEWRSTIVSELAVPDPNVTVNFTEEKNKYDVYADDDTTDKLITLIMILPDGIASLHKYFAKKVESCVNVGVLETQDDHFYITALIRSAVASKKYYQLDKINKICDLLNVEHKITKDLPQWDYNANSKVYEVIKHIYSDLEPNVAQGTCEQGIFLANMPHAEACGVGPMVENPHSPNERMVVATIQDDWNRFVEVLKAMKEYKTVTA